MSADVSPDARLERASDALCVPPGTSVILVDPIAAELEISTDAGPVLHPDGVYLGLAEDPYHADPALGSTDIKRLRTSGPDYWWTSTLNPNRPAREDKAHLVFGTAVHKLVLEGAAAFLAAYQREPEGMLRTLDDLVKWLAVHGVTKAPRTKAAAVEAITTQIELLAQGGLIAERPIIEEEVLRAAADAGQTILKGEIFDRIVGAGAAIAANDGLATAFQNGQPEVSIFWTVEVDGVPVRCKCRFDYLKPRGVGDLKSLRNSRSIDFVEACRRAISEFRYDIQAEHYLRGRKKLPELVAAGKIFGASPEVEAWLRDQVAPAAEFAFAWVFYQAEGAPNVKSFTLSPENPILSTYAAPEVDRGLRTFVEFSRIHPPGQAWRLASPVEEISIEELPAWFARS